MSLSKLLYGPNIRITALTNDDRPTMIRWSHDSEFARLLDSNPACPKTESMLAQWLEENQKASDLSCSPFACRTTTDRLDSSRSATSNERTKSAGCPLT